MISKISKYQPNRTDQKKEPVQSSLPLVEKIQPIRQAPKSTKNKGFQDYKLFPLKKNYSLIHKTQKVRMPRVDLCYSDPRIAMIYNYILHFPNRLSPFILISSHPKYIQSFIHSYIKEKVLLDPNINIISIILNRKNAYETKNLLENKLKKFNILLLNIEKCKTNRKSETLEAIKEFMSNLKPKSNHQVIICSNRDYFTKLSKKQAQCFFGFKVRIVSDKKRDVKQSYFSKYKENISMDTIVKAVASEFNIPTNKLFTNKMSSKIILLRQIAIFIALNFTNMTKSAVGLYFQRINHTTVLHTEKKISQMLQKDPYLARVINQIVKKLTV